MLPVTNVTDVLHRTNVPLHILASMKHIEEKKNFRRLAQ